MMVLTADGSVANPRPGIAAAAAVRASLATLEAEGRDDAAAAAAALWRLHRCSVDEGLGISAGLSSAAGGGGGMAGAAMVAACDALAVWRDDYEVCWAGCELLGELLSCFQQGRVVALEIGAAERVARALQRHHGAARRRRAGMDGRGGGRPYPQVGFAGCRALRALMQHHRDGGRTAAYVAESHGAQAVVDTLAAASVMEAEVAALAMSTLVDMLPPDDGSLLPSSADGSGGGSMAARRTVLRAGAVDTAVGAMRGLPGCLAIQEQGVRFLGTLVSMGDAENQESAAIAVARAGGITAILAALLGHPRTNSLDGRCSTTHYFGIWALHTIACCGDDQPAAQGRAGRVLLRQSVGKILTQVAAGGTGRSEREGGTAELLAVREKHGANRTLVRWCEDLLDVADDLLGERREAARFAVAAARGRRGRVVARGDDGGGGGGGGGAAGGGGYGHAELDMQASLRAFQTMSFGGTSGGYSST